MRRKAGVVSVEFVGVVRRAGGSKRLETTVEETVQIPKPGADDRDYFHSLLPDEPQVQVKPMFGNLGAFVNGNMFCGLFGTDVGVRLTEPDDRARLTLAGGGPFGPSERPMGGYLSLPPRWQEEPGHPTARGWVTLAFGQVAALAPKTPKPRKTRAAG